MQTQLSAPAVGPIVGHTTSLSSRIWIQAAAGAGQRVTGVAALYDAGGNYINHSLRFFRLHRRDEYAGVVNYTQLTPATAYQVRLAVMQGEADAGADAAAGASIPPEGWRAALEQLPQAACRAAFRTFPETGKSMSFLFGSCRYPGLLWPARKADRIFAAALRQFRVPDGAPQFMLLNGDQIYADKLSRRIPLFRAATPAEFRARYVQAFTTRHMAELLRSVPTYMILDDHEIEDNWNQERLEDRPELFNVAITAYRRYQWLHSPRNYAERGEVAPGEGDRLFYSYTCAGYPFFVLDSRTLRMQNDDRCDLAENHLLGDPALDAPEKRAQLPLLCEWLARQQQLHGNRPKFVVSPDSFVPNDIATAGSDERAKRMKCRDDAWAAFPATRRKLLQAIVEAGVQNVVFLCGDAHGSCVAEMHFMHKNKGRLPLKAFSITSSAFYWPWPFSNGKPESMVHDSARQDDHFDVNENVVMQYTAYAFCQENNFTRVDVRQGEIQVQHFDREGAALDEAEILLLVPD